jgi:hypothetical protein
MFWPIKAKRLPAKVRLIVLGFLVGIIVAELALRLVGYSFPEFYIADVARGYALRPNVQGWYRKEGESFVSINSEGLHDREHSKAKPPHTIRVAVVGDSFAESLQVPIDATFWAIMEARLKECASAADSVEVLNFGVSGYGTAQELITLRERVWDYSPDIVLLAITTNNDITDNSRLLRKTNDVPYFVYKDGQLVLDDSFRAASGFTWKQATQTTPIRFFRDRSRVIQLIIEAYRGLRLLLASLRSSHKSSLVPAGDQKPDPRLLVQSVDLGIDNFVYLEPANRTWQDAWSVTENLIVQMCDEVRARGAKFVAVTLSNGVQVTPAPETRAAFMKQFGATDLFYPDRRIKSLGDRKGFSVITLAPPLQAYAEQNKVFLHGFGDNLGSGHWNVNGHRVAGEMLADKLCEEGFLK